MKLTPTGLLTYEDCPRKYWYTAIARVRTRQTAANLVFGEVIHTVIATALRQPRLPSPEEVTEWFDQYWENAIASQEVEYSTTQSPASLAATGRALATQWAETWPHWELTPLVDEQGEPLIERRLRTALTPALTLSGTPDLIAMDGQGRIVIVDFKTPAQACDTDFPAVADQLTAYQLLVENHAEALGISRIDRLGFVELIKRKVPSNNRGKGPEVLPPLLVDRRPDETLADYRQKALWVTEAIHQGRFPKRTGQAYNTPCALCHYRRHCQFGETDGLLFPEDEAKTAAETEPQAALSIA